MTTEAFGTFDAQARDVLMSIVDARLPFLISGGTGSGKTTLLSAMLGQVVLVAAVTALTSRQTVNNTLEMID